jgi:polyhydroxyalkanoate synthesis regulator phasin
MSKKDIVLLEQAYQKILLKENPDKVIDPVSGNLLDGDTVPNYPFGFVCIEHSKEVKVHSRNPSDKFIFSDFGPEWKHKFYIGKLNGVHTSLVYYALRDMIASGRGSITLRNGKVYHVSQLDMDEKTLNSFLYDIQEWVNERSLLFPAGRFYKENHIVSLWCKEEEFNLSLIKVMFDSLNILDSEYKRFYIEFLGDDKPNQTIEQYLSGKHNPSYSKEEQEARDKKAAEDFSIIHTLAASNKPITGKAKEELAKRKKAMSDRESLLRAQGIRPSLQTRQQAMASESNMRDYDTILLEQAYNKIYLLQEDVNLAKQLVQQGKLSQEDFNTIMSTVQRHPEIRKHAGWMSQQWITGARDIDDLRNNVTEWEALAKRGKTSHNQISKYTFDTLKAEVQKLNNQGANISAGELEKDFEVIQDDENLLIVVPHAHAASRKHGLGEFACRTNEDGSLDSAWCTTHRNSTHFDAHYFKNNGTLYYIKVRSEDLQKQLQSTRFSPDYYVVAVEVLDSTGMSPKELRNQENIEGYDSLDRQFTGRKLNQYLSIIGVNKEILITRRTREQRSDVYNISLQKQLKEYIKGGSKGTLDLAESSIKILPDNLRVGEDLYLVGCKSLIGLPENLTVTGMLYISDCSLIKSIPKGLSVGKSLFANGTSIESISPDILVGGNIYLGNTPIIKKYNRVQLKEMFPGIKSKVFFT